MSENRTKIIIGVAGATLAFFGMRALLRSAQQRSHDTAYRDRARARLQSRDGEESNSQNREEGVPVEGTRYQLRDQPDRQPIPTTGMGTVDVLEMDKMETQPVETGDQVSVLAQALINFEDMIEQLKDRRAQAGSDPGNGDIRSLTAEDRSRFRELADNISYQLEGYAEGYVEDDPLQARIFRLTVKVRDALQNLGYSDADLFRIYGEVRSEACAIAAKMPAEAGMEQVVQRYECQ